MNEKAQVKFRKIERELVMLNNIVKNEESRKCLRMALQNLGEAYDIAGGR